MPRREFWITVVLLVIAWLLAAESLVLYLGPGDIVLIIVLAAITGMVVWTSREDRLE